MAAEAAAKTPERVEILVIGAGPTGLGAASRLHMHGKESWRIVDQAPEAGGLSCTVEMPEGFLFDMGGHVIFSHFDYFDQLCDAAIGSGEESWCDHERVSYVRCRGSWVPYPFQNNLSALPMEEKVACLRGLVEAGVAAAATPTTIPRTFDEWILRRLGTGIADVFMRPYNYKVWGYPTTEMQCKWLGERVAAADAAAAVENAVRGKVAAGWGPNATFRFPRAGGTGAIWKGVAELLPRDKLLLGRTVTAVDLEAKRVTLSDGSSIAYGSLISTMPLDVLTEATGDAELKEASADLTYSSSHIIGFGFRGAHTHGDRCWLYFPEGDCPFYRATVFSNYAPGNVPDASRKLQTLCLARDVTAAMVDPATATATATAVEETAEAAASSADAAKLSVPAIPDATAETGPYWSLMLEVTESPALPRPSASRAASLGGKDVPALVLEALQGCLNTGMVPPEAELVSVFHRRLERGYPTPSLRRDTALKAMLPVLKEKHSVWSRGRFGAWTYEVANQDRSVMQGVQAVDSVLFGAPELTLSHPDITNARGNKNKDIVFKLPSE